MKSARIVGLGKYLPPKVLTNYDLEKIVDTSDEWITTRTGIKERRIAEKGIGASYLAVKAARIALKRAAVRPSELDLIIVATITPDTQFIALMTDGLLPPPKWIGQERNWGQIAQILRLGGLKGLFEHTRKIERDDSQLDYPRVKMHDDATGMLIRINHQVN